MKKNVMMRVASIMLVLVLLTSSVISGTFAKYVTEGSASDSARVAKFGVEVSADFKDTFTRGYKVTSVYSTTDEGEASVWADADVGVVAPGTYGELANFTVTGKPEVDVEVTYTADLTLTGWEYEGVAKYCPIKITVNGTTYQIAVGTDAAELEAAVEAAINSYKNTYQAGTDLSVVGDDLAVSWEWPYESGHDDADTALGDQAADDNAATIKLDVKCTVTQID